LPPADAKAVAALIDDLGHKQFSRRAAATVELEKLAGTARPALEARLTSEPPLETRQRLLALLERLEAPLTDAGQLRVVRAIEVLEWIGTPEAREVLERLAGRREGTRAATLAWQVMAAARTSPRTSGPRA
jgi:hypothetical protein